MGFNRRKLEDQRRDAGEKDVAARRATDASNGYETLAFMILIKVPIYQPCFK
jgi:hypothetical protein